MKVRHTIAALSAIALVGSLGITVSGEAQAASYAKLKSNGFSTGRLSRNKAGTRGWVVRKGAERYFCRLRLGLGSSAALKGSPPSRSVGRCSKMR